MARSSEDELQRLNLNLHPNEASGLLTVENDALLEAHGWEFALWAVLDEGEIQDCIAVIGHERGAALEEGWEILRLHAVPTGDDEKTEDAEAITRHDGWVYALGSHFGGKNGPCSPKGRSLPASAKTESRTRLENRLSRWRSPAGASRCTAS